MAYLYLKTGLQLKGPKMCNGHRATAVPGREHCRPQELGGGCLVGSLSGVLGSNPGEAASSTPAPPRSGVSSGVSPSLSPTGFVGVSSRLPCCCGFAWAPFCKVGKGSQAPMSS